MKVNGFMQSIIVNKIKTATVVEVTSAWRSLTKQIMCEQSNDYRILDAITYKF